MLLVDVVMPRMSGVQLVEQCREVGQEFKVLYMSGYAESMTAYPEVFATGINYIRKPFTSPEFGKKSP